MTHYTDADLVMADRHIAEGGERIARLEEVLISLRSHGLSTSQAEKLLILFNETQAANQNHRDAIAAALEDVCRRSSDPSRKDGHWCDK